MDFELDEEQQAVRELARGILEKEVDHERLKQLEAAGEDFDRELWATLARAGLLGLAIPEEHGGMGYGLVELCVLAQELGRVVAPVPALATLAMGATAISSFGSNEQKKKWLPRICAGKAVVAVAMARGAWTREGRAPLTATPDPNGGWALSGEVSLVQAAGISDLILVPACLAGGNESGGNESGGSAALFLVDPACRGLQLTGARSATGERLYTVSLDSVTVADQDLLGGLQSRAFDRTRDCGLAVSCALQTGVSEKAVEMTAAYVSERQQFGRPIGSFQAVHHRMADCYVDLESMRWTAWRAAWLLAEGRDAARELMVARHWSAEGGARIASATQHLHAGMGVDTDYPLYRYFLNSKALELGTGSAAAQLAALGRSLADEATGNERQEKA
ncbi:MAG: acyl-CoA dehydrogenase family protein [bacterium]